MLMVRHIRAFAVANGIDRGGVSVAVAAAFASLSVTALLDVP